MTAAPQHSGFTDSVRESQAVFRAVMMALARPGSLQPLAAALAPPAPLTAGLAAIALALADHEASLWLDAPLAASPEATEFLKFHTGARQVADPSTAAFALISDARAMPALADFAQGTDEYPDRSTTLVIAVSRIAADGPLVLEGPGIKGTTRLAIEPLPRDFLSQRAANHALFPRGVDCVFVAPAIVAALPRTTVVGEG